MKIRVFISALSLLFGITSVYGQVNLSEMEPDSPDSLTKSRILYFSPGRGGRNMVWDFSYKLGSKESSKVMFMKDSTGLVSITERGKIYYYRTTPDTLFLCGSESTLEKRDYAQKKISRRFPLVYGDSITLRNVLRVHTIDSYSICMDIDSAALDTARLAQVIDERYEWYLPESQYPVIEDVTSTSYYNMDAVGTTKYAYCNLPEDMTAYYITSDEENDADEQEGFTDEEQQMPDIIHYSVETRGKTIHIAYDLDEDATITTIVASHTGMLYSSRQWTQAAGQGYSVQIDCNGLRPGTYILYINVNGKVYSEKVTL